MAQREVGDRSLQQMRKAFGPRAWAGAGLVGAQRQRPCSENQRGCSMGSGKTSLAFRLSLVPLIFAPKCFLLNSAFLDLHSFLPCLGQVGKLLGGNDPLPAMRNRMMLKKSVFVVVRFESGLLRYGLYTVIFNIFRYTVLGF